MFHRFIILSHGRTGSTYLVNNLNRHPNIAVFQELFHATPSQRQPVEGRIWQNGEDSARFLEEVVFPLARDRSAVGFKLFYFHARGDAMARRVWDMIAETPTLPLILLHRKNIFAGFVSEQRARQSNIWHPTQGADYRGQQELTLDVDAALRYVQRTRERQKLGCELVQGHPGLEMFYEDLASDASATIRRVTEFLGLGPVEPWSDFSAGSADASATRILNLEECRRALEAIGAAWMVEPYEDISVSDRP